VTFRWARLSSVTSDGFFKLKKCLEMPDVRSVPHNAGRVVVEGSGGVRAGKLMGMGFDGGGRSFCVSCWPASRLPKNKQCQHQRRGPLCIVHISNETGVMLLRATETADHTGEAVSRWDKRKMGGCSG
jgi:hypothetical protein